MEYICPFDETAVDSKIDQLKRQGYQQVPGSKLNSREFCVDGPHEIDPLTHARGYTVRWQD